MFPSNYYINLVILHNWLLIIIIIIIMQFVANLG